MMHQGNAIIDKAGEEKAKMKVDDILETFNRIVLNVVIRKENERE